MSAYIRVIVLPSLLLLVFTLGCSSSGLRVKKQAYAPLAQEKTYPYSFPQVWKALEESVRRMKVVSRHPENPSPQEMKKLRERSLKTDWVYTLSRDKYHEVLVNDLPQRINLRTRVQFHIIVSQVVGGVRVQVKPEEEIEIMNNDGSSAGYEATEQLDTSRTYEMLQKIELNLLSLPHST